MMNYFSCLKYLVWVSALGASLITPIVICVYVAFLLQKKFMLGGWVFIIALFVGIFAALLNLKKFFDLMKKQAEKKDKEE